MAPRTGKRVSRRNSDSSSDSGSDSEDAGPSTRKRRTRSRLTLTAVRNGRQNVQTTLSNIHLTATGAGMGTSLTGSTDAEYMSCSAELTGIAINKSGEYDASRSLHAEMDALSQFILAGGSPASVQSIEISSPPCRQCAFVLNLFGLLGKVNTTGDIRKQATSAWAWPAALRNPANFDTEEWEEITAPFLQSGYGGDAGDLYEHEEQILSEVIDTVQKGAA